MMELVDMLVLETNEIFVRVQIPLPPELLIFFRMAEWFKASDLKSEVG